MTPGYLILLLLFPVFGYSQSKFDSTKIRKHVLDWFNNFPQTNNDSLIEYRSFPSVGYKRIKKIKISELYQLTNHPLASVRIFASEQLTWKQPSFAFEILQNHLGDTTEWFCIAIEDGCASKTFIDYQITLCAYSNLTENEKKFIEDLREARLNSRRQFEIIRWQRKYNLM